MASRSPIKVAPGFGMTGENGLVRKADQSLDSFSRILNAVVIITFTIRNVNNDKV